MHDAQHHRPRPRLGSSMSDFQAPSSQRRSSGTSGITTSSSVFPRTFAASSSSGSKSTRPTSLNISTIEKPDRFESISLVGRPGSPERAGFDPADPSDPDSFGLNPARSDSCHLLATLATSNHTLSPFGRALHHVASRSTPPISRLPSVVSTRRSSVSGIGSGSKTTWPRPTSQEPDVPVAARRKRLFKIGGAGTEKDDGRPKARKSAWPSPETLSDSGSDYSSYFPRQSPEVARSSFQA